MDFDGETIGQHCTAYGPDGEILWTVSRRPQPAWDNVPGGPRYPDADLFGDAKWEGKQHSSFEWKYRRGLRSLEPWQSRPTPNFAVKFYNCGEDNLLPGKKNGAVRLRNLDGVIGEPCLAAFQQPTDGCRDCTGPAWEWWTISSKRSAASGR